jgi:hypothetical protein
VSDALPEVADLGIHREQVPDGTRCTEHTDEPAHFRCAICRTHRCEDCLWGERSARQVCTSCAKDGLPQPVAWERRGEIGVVRGFAESVREILVSPVRFYRTPALEADAVGGFEHGLVSFAVGQIALVLQALLVMALFGSALAAATRAPQVAAVFGGYGCMLIALVPAMMVHIPVTTLSAVGVASVAIHGTLRLLGAAKAPFYAGTVRATSYAFATHALFVVPVLGTLLAVPWTLVLETIGVREVHKTGTLVAVIAVLAFRVVILAAVIAFYVALGALAYTAARR